MTVSGTASRHRDVEILVGSRDRPERFAELFEAYYDEVYRYARGRVGADVAEDVASETFVVAFRKRDRFDAAEGYVRAWLYGIATNLIRSHRRAEERAYRALAQSHPEHLTHPDDDRVVARVAAQALSRTLAEALAALPRGDRDVLLLVALGGLDYAETAAALDIPYGTVGSRLNRARRRLRTALAAVAVDQID